ncbi:hypothetical protein, partial [Vibrio parahaemolyticus]|uniref:hypothetical protein n=6 Tax=Vibrio TaxID=662 RepID=UPI0019535066
LISLSLVQLYLNWRAIAQIIAAITAVSGVLYCFKKHLTSDLTNSLQTLMKSSFLPYIQQGFLLNNFVKIASERTIEKRQIISMMKSKK